MKALAYMDFDRTLIRRVTGWLLLGSFISASAGALVAIRLDRPDLGVTLLLVAACGLGLAIVATLAKPFARHDRQKPFRPGGRSQFSGRK